MKRRTFLVFLLPSVLVIGVTQLYPLGIALNMSMNNWNMLQNRGTFVGLGNYLKVLQNSDFWGCMLYSVGLTVVAVSLELVLGVILALLIDDHIQHVALINTALLIPIVVSPVVAGLIFKWLFNPTFGLFMYGLYLVGLSGTAWLSHPVLASGAILIAELWQFTPFMVLVTYAGLQSLPAEPVEAALVDGATQLDIVRFVKLPLLALATIILWFLRLIGKISSLAAG
jgi:multiple sugar transport system permease protein